MEWTKEIKDKIEKLDSKYASMGQDLPAYLDGLLYANPLHYWDYAYVDTLLSLQHPKTDFPDEQIFIIYHQIIIFTNDHIIFKVINIKFLISYKPSTR